MLQAQNDCGGLLFRLQQQAPGRWNTLVRAVKTLLAHRACNNAKSDHLVAEDHVAAWKDRNSTHAGELQSRFSTAALSHSHSGSQQIARWADDRSRGSSRASCWATVFIRLGGELAAPRGRCHASKPMVKIRLGYAAAFPAQIATLDSQKPPFPRVFWILIDEMSF